jgi:hypothetical protein
MLHWGKHASLGQVWRGSFLPIVGAETVIVKPASAWEMLNGPARWNTRPT